MKATELRIGNRVSYKGIEVVVEGYTFDYVRFTHEALSIGESIEKFDPILLTEEWIKVFGFRKVKNEYFSQNGSGIMLTFYKDQFRLYKQIMETSVMDNGRILIKRSVQYVHELQNLFFALTGEELTVKETVTT